MKIVQVHFDEDQFENKREDGRKLLRPFAKPNLLEKHTIEKEEQSTEIISSKKIESCKYYIALILMNLCISITSKF